MFEADHHRNRNADPDEDSQPLIIREPMTVDAELISMLVARIESLARELGRSEGKRALLEDRLARLEHQVKTVDFASDNGGLQRGSVQPSRAQPDDQKRAILEDRLARIEILARELGRSQGT